MRKVNKAIKVNLAIASSTTQRKRRRRNEMLVHAPSSLPQDLVEEIFIRLPLKTLIQFKCLSKEWRSTIESHSFGERHLKLAQSHVDHPKVMFITEENSHKNNMPLSDTDLGLGFTTMCLESGSVLSSTFINFPQRFSFCISASESCNGLLCILCAQTQVIYVVNPTIRWFRQLPPARLLISLRTSNPTIQNLESVGYTAFVKAFDYKLVWLYNSEHYNADALSPNEGVSVTKCEVFDFKTNAWRYLACTPSYRILHNQPPVSTSGSIYWLTEPYDGEIKVVSLDFYTETFQILPKIIPGIARTDPKYINICTLDNHLCISKRDKVTMIQEIWRLKSSQDSWDKIYTIDLLSCSSCWSVFRDEYHWTRKGLYKPFTPIAICKNKNLLLSNCYSYNLVKYDPQTKSLSLVFERPSEGKYVPFFFLVGRRYVPYVNSLISHI